MIFSFKHVRTAALIALMASVFAFAGCERESDLEQAIDSVGDATEDAADAVGDAGRDLRDSVEDASDEMKDAIDDTK
jgi:hypothetical protein